MNKKTKIIILVGLLLLIAVGVIWRKLQKEKIAPAEPVLPPQVEFVQEAEQEPVPAATPAPIKKVESVKTEVPKTRATPTPAPPTLAAPPPVEIHKDLIPKDISIVRVYYSQMITGPGSLIEFDINGSGFNEEFEKMITVESGSPFASVKNLKLMTPNQIHGILIVKSDAPTGAVFPQVLIQGKIVFRAPEPFAVIRPGEVFNLIFTEMAENGRSGRFRVYTNLTEAMFNAFQVVPDTTGIIISNLSPQLPFVVDGTINVEGAREGSFGIKIQIGETIIWDRPGLIRVIKPNVGQTGLVQQVRAVDGFHRPMDEPRFVLQGSGFQPQDAEILEAVVDGFEKTESTFTFKSPGRMDLSLRIPAGASEGIYTLHIRQKDVNLITKERAFVVVGKNWLKRFVLDPPLHPGSTSVLRMEGRDLDQEFIQSLKSEVDAEGLSIGQIGWVSPELASASVSAGASLAPGDYLIHLTSHGKPVVPLQGGIIRILPPE